MGQSETYNQWNGRIEENGGEEPEGVGCNRNEYIFWAVFLNIVVAYGKT